MPDIIKTNMEQVLTGGGGTFRIADANPHDDLKVLSIIPESATVIAALTVVGPDGVETDVTASIASGGRGLSAMVPNVAYMAGTNSYFKLIELTSGEITCNKA